MKFEDYNIDKKLKKNIKELGFRRPTDIQYKAIPPILKGEDLLAIAQTGTGKTAAFAIPIVEKLIRSGKKPNGIDVIRALVLVPTRELAEQINDVFEKFTLNTSLRTFSLIGGMGQEDQIVRLQKGVDILISTPGRLFDLNHQKKLKLDKVAILVLDEADHMLDLGFLRDIKDLMRLLPRKRQTLFFSATIDSKIKKLAYSLVINPIRIHISPKDPVSRNIEHAVVFVEMDDKRFFLERVIKNNPESKFLVFVRTKVRAERVKKAMERVGVHSETIHSDKMQETRLKTMKDFKLGHTKVLVATDVSARGIDIPNVDYVVNYDMPEQTENYVHRVGRTGRGVKKGLAFSFCSRDEKTILSEIESFIGNKIAEYNLDKHDYAQIVKASDEVHADWKTLLSKLEEEEMSMGKLKKKRNRKK
jgi:ATP-dependent RNA helicase RhlE